MRDRPHVTVVGLLPPRAFPVCNEVGRAASLLSPNPARCPVGMVRTETRATKCPPRYPGVAHPTAKRFQRYCLPIVNYSLFFFQRVHLPVDLSGMFGTSAHFRTET